MSKCSSFAGSGDVSLMLESHGNFYIFPHHDRGILPLASGQVPRTDEPPGEIKYLNKFDSRRVELEAATRPSCTTTYYGRSLWRYTRQDPRYQDSSRSVAFGPVFGPWDYGPKNCLVSWIGQILCEAILSYIITASGISLKWGSPVRTFDDLVLAVARTKAPASPKSGFRFFCSA